MFESHSIKYGAEFADGYLVVVDKESGHKGKEHVCEGNPNVLADEPNQTEKQKIENREGGHRSNDILEG